MDPYLFTLVVGGGGLTIMALLGFSGGGHHVRAGTGSHALHGSTPATLGHASHSCHGSHSPAHAAGHHVGREPRGPGALLGLFSPRVLFSLLLGFGATGMMLRPLIPWSLLLLVLSVIAALLFEHAVMHPLWKFLLNFASQPAKMLNHLLLQEAKAANDFNRAGHGLVLVELDGEARQILGTLCRPERESGVRVHAGDRLFIREIDEARNSCTVSMLSC